MLFSMHLANTKYSFEFKGTPCISHIFLCGSQHLGSLCGALERQHCCLCSSCAGHTGTSALKGWAPDSPGLSNACIVRCHDGFVLIPKHEALPRDREDAQLLPSPPCLAVCIPMSVQQEQGPPRVHHQESAIELSRQSEPGHPAGNQSQDILQHRHCSAPAHSSTHRGQHKQARGAWKGLGEGTLLKVVGRAENFLLSPGLALKPFSLLLSADVLQRCET